VFENTGYNREYRVPYRKELSRKLGCENIGFLPKSATPIRVGPHGYFTQISITTPIVSALKNYYI
jgi:hypothetical protein